MLLLGITPVTVAHTRITTDINWSNEIRIIFEEKCMICHHPGGMAPDYVNLSVYGTDTDPGARAWAVAIEEEIMLNRMPPWKPDHRFNAFANTKQLTEEETWKVLAWIRGGAPQGPLRNLPVPEQFQTPQFQFGEPDIVFELTKPFTFSDEDMEGFATETFEVELEEDTYMTGYEFLVENPRNIHSITAWLISPDEEATIDVEIVKEFDPLADEDDLEEVFQRPLPQGRQLLGQWARGDLPVLLPDAAGRLLRKGSKLELNIQYIRTDFDLYETITDHSKIGLFMAGVDEEIDLLVESIAMEQPEFTIPAEDNNFKVAQEFTVEEAMHLIGVNPMLGPLGKNLEVTATYPDGRNRTLIWIPEYKQKWDSSYQFAEPIAAPAGTTIQVVAHYDNSEDNWDNPNSPPVDAKAGHTYKEARLRTTVDYMLDTHLNVEEVFVPEDRPERQEGTGMLVPGDPIGIDTGDSPDPKSNQPTIEEFNELVVQGDRENQKDPKELDLHIYWCPMRGDPCEMKDYHEPGTCDDCFMALKPKSFFFEGKEPAPDTYSWPLTSLGRTSLYWCPNREQSDHPLKEYSGPGTCDVDGVTLVHKGLFEEVHTFTCMTPECKRNGAIYYGPGLCMECGQPVKGMGHMDHTPKNGGWQFFMADNLYHHLEGCVHNPGEFKLYFYDDWKVDLDARNFKGIMVTETTNESTGEVTETETPMYIKKEGDTWMTADVPEEFPFSFYVRVWLSGEEKRYDFEFEDYTPLPDPTKRIDYTIHGHDCLELVIPTTLPEILSEIKVREAQLIAAIEQKQWLGMHCPSYETKDLTWALQDHLDGLNIRQRGVYKKVKGMMNNVAVALDSAGDAADPPRVKKAYAKYADGLSKLRDIFPDLK
jgi:hypothetical protein